jgi:RND superfamily putative drug exporter
MTLFTRWGRKVIRFRWLVLAGTVMLTIAGIAWGSGVFGSLASGGFTDPGSQSPPNAVTPGRCS